MKLFAGLFGRKSLGAIAPKTEPKTEEPRAGDDLKQINDPAVSPIKTQPKSLAEESVEISEELAEANDETIERVLETAAPSAVNIWDLDAEAEHEEKTIAPTAAPASKRARRNRTRLIGFDTSEGDVVDLFEDAPAVKPTLRAEFPVGWLLVVDGPGHGSCYSLVAGMSQIGRGEDQAVQLDFGDMAVSRNNHAAVVFDADSKKFVLGHGGKANIVRLNGQPVISNEDLSDGDQIKIGDTTLQLKVLCGDDFDWSNTGKDEEREDVAIA
jgi:predicted component of type VI protein secretion system